jgi:hypothetical protein
MAEKIAFSALIASVQSGTITKEQIADCFELDVVRTSGFKPVFKIKTERVDVAGVEQIAFQVGHQLALDAEKAVQRQTLEMLAAPPRYATIAIGDSWFSDPRKRTVVDLLKEDGYAINNMAQAGQTLDEMLARREYMPHLSNGRVSHFLFSGGGNDVIGRLSEAVTLLNVDHLDPEKPADVEYYIKDIFFDSIFPQVKRCYRQLLADINGVSPSTKLLVHGYAYARPVAHGPFLGEQFSDRGFDLTAEERKAMAWRIVMKFIEYFNQFLVSLAQGARNVEYLNFREIVRNRLGPVGHRTFGVDEDWFDEIHPSVSAERQMAEKYKEALAVAVAVAAVP